jgi:hypothetical protein
VVSQIKAGVPRSISSLSENKSFGVTPYAAVLVTGIHTPAYTEVATAGSISSRSATARE